VRVGAQEVWQEMLGWCWELEERRGERKSMLRLRLAPGRGRETRRAKLWRGGEARRLRGVRSTLLETEPS